MFSAGFQLYVMLIEVFEAEQPRIKWYYLFGYGVPLIIVVVSGLVDPLSYGTDRYCWLRADNFFILSFVGPVILVILVSSNQYFNSTGVLIPNLLAGQSSLFKYGNLQNVPPQQHRCPCEKQGARQAGQRQVRTFLPPPFSILLTNWTSRSMVLV
jgi:7 transmembrane receptor (Secretin family)